MKERIVLDFGAEIKNICNGCAEGVKAKCKQTQKDHLRCVIQTSELKEFKTEKYPTSWEELEKLVIDNCHNYAIEIDNTKKRYSIEYKGLIFYNFGVVEFSIATKTIDGDSVKFNRCFATDMQPQQMWAIIKNLIGEE